MTPSYGNPILQVRLTPDTHEKLKEVAGESEGGKAGGVSLFVRRLIYRELGEQMPDQWGKDSGALNDLIGILADVEKYENKADAKGAFKLYMALLDSLEAETDLVLRNMLFMLVGRLTPLLLGSDVFNNARLSLARRPLKKLESDARVN